MDILSFLPHILIDPTFDPTPDRFRSDVHALFHKLDCHDLRLFSLRADCREQCPQLAVIAALNKAQTIHVLFPLLDVGPLEPLDLIFPPGEGNVRPGHGRVTQDAGVPLTAGGLNYIGGALRAFGLDRFELFNAPLTFFDVVRDSIQFPKFSWRQRFHCGSSLFVSAQNISSEYP